MTTMEATGGAFELGRVMQRTFKVIGDNLSLFAISGLALIALPVFAASVVGFLYPELWVIALASMAGGIMAFVGSLLMQGVVVHSAISGLNGRSIRLGEALGVGARKALPLLGLGILQSLGFALGLLLLVVPGLMLMTAWSVAAPVLVMEKRSIEASFGRSGDLTRGHRWSIFGLLVIYFVLAMIISVAVQGLAAAAGVTTAQSGFVTTTQAPSLMALAAVLVSALTNAVQGVISAAGAAAIYYELRTGKEGAAPDQLAAVFDEVRPQVVGLKRDRSCRDRIVEHRGAESSFDLREHRRRADEEEPPAALALTPQHVPLVDQLWDDAFGDIGPVQANPGPSRGPSLGVGERVAREERGGLIVVVPGRVDRLNLDSGKLRGLARLVQPHKHVVDVEAIGLLFLRTARRGD